MARSFDREHAAIAGRRSAGADGRSSRRRAISAAEAVALFERRERISARFPRENTPVFPSQKMFPPQIRASACSSAASMLRYSCAAIAHFTRRVWETLSPAPPARATIMASTIVLAILITTSVVTSEIDLSKLMPGATTDASPRIVVVDNRLMNQGDAPALNLEVTRPRYRLVGTLAAGEGIPIPADDFAVQYEWQAGEKTQRETRTFKTGQDRVAGHTKAEDQPALHADLTVTPHGSGNGTIPQGLAASYDPATHLLTVTADTPVEVRVDGFLLRPISRTDKDGAEYRFAQANVLVLGQDLKRGETTVFEVVFTKPQDFYSIPIYVHEPGKPAVYLTVSVSTAPHGGA